MKNTIAVSIKNESELNACKRILELLGYKKSANFENNTPNYIIVNLETKWFHSTEIANNVLKFEDFIKYMLTINETKNQ